MYHVECTGCGTSAYLDCVCATLGHDPAVAQAHHPGCKLSDIDGQIVCPPASGCCQDDHAGDPGRRGHALLVCSADHSADPCPAPGSCRLFAGLRAHHEATAAAYAQHTAAGRDEPHAAELLKALPGECPGGHHGFGVRGCPVCRELIVTAVGGTIVRAVAA